MRNEDWLEAQIDLAREDSRARYVASVNDARDEGYELCCVYCGIGVHAQTGVPFGCGEDHEKWCPCAGERANEQAAKQAARS